MSLQDDLTSVQRRLDDRMACVSRLGEHAGDSLDMRRVRTDANHLRDSLALLQAAAPAATGGRKVEMVSVPDTPYDRGLWADAEDEGLGSPHRHAP